MKRTALLLLSAVWALMAISQTNLDFELVDAQDHPTGWYAGGEGYIVKADSLNKKEGNFSISLRSDPDAGSRNFGVCTMSIPEVDFKGKEITLKGYLKTEAVSKDGYAGLWLRVDGKSGPPLAFDNMSQQQIRGTNDWTEYTITLPLSDEAHRIVFGALMVGTGQTWADDLQILVDGKPISEAPKKERKIYPAELDSAFYQGSGIELNAVSEKQILDLTVLGKVWGFVKYYHPAVARGEYNWDFELFRILPRFLESPTAEDRNALLLDWIDRLGPVPPCDTCRIIREGDYKMLPDLEWIREATLGEELADRLQHLEKNRNRDEHYYIDSVPNVRNPVFKNEHDYADLEEIDAGYRLLALFRYWNIIQYWFPYKYAIGRDWDEVLEEFVPRFVEAADPLSYRLAVLELIENVHDTHANLWREDEVLKRFRGELHAPLRLQYIEEQFVVTGLYDETKAFEAGFQIGDVIKAVAGKPVDRIVAEGLRYYPASHRERKLHDLARNLLRGNESNSELTIQRGENTLHLTLQRYPEEEVDIRGWLNRQEPDSCYHLLNEEVGYITLENIRSSRLPVIFETFKDTKGIVIDIRNYPSEFVVFSLGRYLMPKPTPFVKFTAGVLDYPGLFEWKYTLEAGEDNPDYYKGKVAILTDVSSLSQAEYTTMAYRVAPRAKVFGSITAAADGNVSQFMLPGGLRTMITGIGVYYPDGRETQRVGILPDVEVRPTIEGIREGKDEVLEKAVEWIESDR
jgi:C-terminal processing protease CtpA/Prc